MGKNRSSHTLLVGKQTDADTLYESQFGNCINIDTDAHTEPHYS